MGELFLPPIYISLVEQPRGMQTVVLGSLLALASAAATISAAPPAALNVSYVLSGTPSGVPPPALGVNSGHNWDPGWLAWVRHLGVSTVRVFGLAGAVSTLETFVTAGGAPWGADLNGVSVASQSGFQAALAQLRGPSGHLSAPEAWANPPGWAAHAALMNATSVAPNGNSMQGVVSALRAAGVQPLLVFWLGCANFAFSTLNPAQPAYWAERWELYKHQYVAARWAFLNGARKLEFWNEPDLNAPCITYYSWLEHYTLQSQAIQNAFADLSADVAAGLIPCPAGLTCPQAPAIYASAFAQASFSGVSAATAQPPSAGLFPGSPGYYPGDYYAYMANVTVAAEHVAFPPWPPGGGLLGSASANVQNMNALSIHSYGKYGYALGQLGASDVSAVAAARGASGPALGARLARMPVAVTEHAAHTTAAWNALGSTPDNDYEASRLAAQLLWLATGGPGSASGQGLESFIFKFSTLEQSSSITPGCTPYTNASMTTCGAHGNQVGGGGGGGQRRGAHP
jgi:hypothetical protein